MFKLVKRQTFKWPVKVMLPSNGKHEVHEFTATFVKPESDDLTEILNNPDPATNTAFMKRHVEGWDDRIVDESDKPLPFTPENFDLVMSDVYVRPAVIAAYVDGVLGAKRKN